RLPEDWTQEEVEQRVQTQLRAARGEVKRLPVAAFPAVAPAALARAYASGREIGELEKKARLTFSVATGRL
ncbi:hypothetical protein, partial [Sphingomonas adhaesiva]